MIAQETPKKKERKKKEEKIEVAAEQPKPQDVVSQPIELSEKPKSKTVIKESPTKKVVDFATYQDSLMYKYPQERTIEITQDAHKKTTRVFMNNGQFVEIYTMVEHSWGATYYFLEEYPTGTTSIGYAAFVNKTKLTDLNNIQATPSN
jgi:archaellum component FlaD/FlaE